jgi:hypothetical protein
MVRAFLFCAYDYEPMIKSHPNTRTSKNILTELSKKNNSSVTFFTFLRITQYMTSLNLIL